MLASRAHNIIRSKCLPKGYDLIFDPVLSRGSMIHDSLTGRKFIDMFGFYGSCPIGHNHPKMVDFAPELGRMAIHNPSNSNVYTEEYAKFVETFSRFLPAEFKYMFLITGGALAVENALKAAFDWKVRLNQERGIDTNPNNLKVIHFRNAFHGRSGYTMSLTNTDYWKTAHYPKFDWPLITFPSITHDLDETIRQEVDALNRIRMFISHFPDAIAALIIEPIQGEGGDNHIRPEFWQELREICTVNNIMFIADEVQTGLGLTGRTWAYEWLGDAPDIIVFGKKTQVCGFASTARLDLVTDHVFHKASRINSTWGGSLTDMMRSRKYMEIIEEEKLIDHAETMGTIALDMIKTVCQQHPSITSRPRGRGLMVAFDLVTPEVCERFKNLMYDRNVLIASCGTNSIRLRPMLDVELSNLQQVATAMDETLKTC